MTIGIVGIKRGMTRIFTEEGASVPVTVIEASPNRIIQVKSIEIDGYAAVQVTKRSINASRVNKPQAGHFVWGASRPVSPQAGHFLLGRLPAGQPSS